MEAEFQHRQTHNSKKIRQNIIKDDRLRAIDYYTDKKKLNSHWNAVPENNQLLLL